MHEEKLSTTRNNREGHTTSTKAQSQKLGIESVASQTCILAVQWNRMQVHVQRTGSDLACNVHVFVCVCVCVCACVCVCVRVCVCVCAVF